MHGALLRRSKGCATPICRYNVHKLPRRLQFRARICPVRHGRSGRSIRQRVSGQRGKRAGRGANATIRTANGTNRKQYCKTKTCSESAITPACYLCNTLPKTACSAAFEAVPLLRVQGCSVIVIRRRRGASRGRPVIGGSLKSTRLAADALISSKRFFCGQSITLFVRFPVLGTNWRLL